MSGGAQPTTLEPLGSTVFVIRPSRGFMPLRLRELWAHRELFLFLVWRDIKVRYAQTKLGPFWTVFQPLGMMLVFTYAFSRIAAIDTGEIPYPLFALAGLTLWLFVARGVIQGATSLVANIPLVTKTAVPRLLLVLSTVFALLVDLVVTLAIFLVFAVAYGRVPTWRFVAVPGIVLVTFALVLGLSLLLAGLNIRYRDVGQALPFIVQLWFFLSPVAYSLYTPGLGWVTLVQALNPLVGIIEAFRWAVLGTAPARGLLAVSIAITIAVFAAGLAYFSRIERTLADDA